MICAVGKARRRDGDGRASGDAGTLLHRWSGLGRSTARGGLDADTACPAWGPPSPCLLAGAAPAPAAPCRWPRPSALARGARGRVVRELADLLALPNVAADSANIRPQRGAHLATARAARRPRRACSRRWAARRRSTASCARRARRARLSTRTTTASPSTRAVGERRPGRRCCATRPLEQGGAATSPLDALPAGRIDPSGASTRARPATTRRRSSPCWPRSTRCARRGIAALGEPQVLLRGRGGGGLAAPARRCWREHRGPARGRRLALLRRPGAPDAAAAGRLRRARRDGPRAHRLRAARAAAQRPLRQLGAEPGGAARAPARRLRDDDGRITHRRASTTTCGRRRAAEQRGARGGAAGRRRAARRARPGRAPKPAARRWPSGSCCPRSTCAASQAGARGRARPPTPSPPRRSASIDFRLVPDQTPERVRDARGGAPARRRATTSCTTRPTPRRAARHAEDRCASTGRPATRPARTATRPAASRAPCAAAVEEALGAPVVRGADARRQRADVPLRARSTRRARSWACRSPTTTTTSTPPTRTCACRTCGTASRPSPRWSPAWGRAGAEARR